MGRGGGPLKERRIVLCVCVCVCVEKRMKIKIASTNK